MKHLKEEELIDVLMGEPHWEDLDRHLEECDSCRAQLETLQLGLDAARQAKPSQRSRCPGLDRIPPGLQPGNDGARHRCEKTLSSLSSPIGLP